MSSAEYLVTEIKRRKKTMLISLVALAIVVIGFMYMRAGSSEIDSIAVMPFTSERTDPNIRHISDAITQRIINGLSSRLPNIRVRPFSAVSRYNGNPPDVQSISKELGVRAVLTGSISKREGDDSIFVSVELIDTDDNRLIWGEQYDRKFADIRNVQEDVLKGVFASIGPKLSEEEKRRREAEDLYLEARTYIDKRTTRSLREAVRLLEMSIAKNSDYAPSYAGMADCYNMLSIYGAEPPKPGFTKAKESAEKALSLDNSLAEAHTSLGFTLFRYNWDWEGSEREFQRAIKLNADYGQAYQWYANCLTALGRFSEAEQQTRRAQELDPTSLPIQAHFGFTYYFARRYDDVIASGQKAIRLDPNFFAARRYLGLAYTQKGMHAQAIAEFQKAVDASGGSWVMKAELGHALAASGDRAGAQKIIEELIQLSLQRYVSPYSIATIYAGMGDKDKAFEWLEKAYEEHADFLAYFKVDPRYEGLRSDPRYENIIRKIGLTP
jgi:TolB-like protein/Tfp pilus assembly protein PilF